MGVAAFIVGAIATVASTVSQLRASSKQSSALRRAAKAQQEAAANERARQWANNAQDLRERNREKRKALAQVLQMGENSGVAGSSGVVGGYGSTFTQATNNIAVTQNTNQLTDNASVAYSQAGFWESKAQLQAVRGSQWSSIGSFGNSLMSWGAGAFNTRPQTKIAAPS